MKAGRTNSNATATATASGSTRNQRMTEARAEPLTFSNLVANIRQMAVDKALRLSPTPRRTVNTSEIATRKYIRRLFRLEGGLLFLYQSLDLIEQLAVFVADRIYDACKHRLDRAGRAVEKPRDHFTENADLHLFLC